MVFILEEKNFNVLNKLFVIKQFLPAFNFYLSFNLSETQIKNRETFINLSNTFI
jgi:hypothetical protein